jgi:error-prone DNA polymerase
MGFYTPSTIVYEAQRRGVKIRNIDVTKSRWDCTVEGDAVRLGLRYVRHIGNAVKEEVEAAIDAGPFLSIRDFVFRMKLNPLALEQLTMIDGFACFGLDRRQALWELLSILRDSPEQLPLTTVETGRHLLEPMNIAETLSADFKGTGLSTDRHPMQLVRTTFKQRNILAAADLYDVPSGRSIVVAGVVIIRQRPHTAKGFLFITLEDETGFANIVVKPNVIERFRKEVVHARALIVKGTVEKRDGVINVIGRHFQPLHFTAETTQVKDLNDKEVAIRSRDFR